MRKLLISSVGVLSMFVMAGQAMADEFRAPPRRERAAAPARAPQQAAPQQQASNWTGGQAGGSNGASSVNNSFVEPGAFNYAPSSSGFPSCGSACYETPFSFSGHKTSYIIGAFLGYRWQVGMWVVGVEGDINWQKGETSLAQNTPPPWLGYEQFTGSQKQGSDGSIRGRIGFLVTPWTLVYATGGVAIGQISGSFSYAGCQTPTCATTISSPGFISIPGPTPGTFISQPTTFVTSATNVTGAASWSDTRVGSTVGAGVETQLWAGVKGRIEYRYTDYGKFSKDVPLTTNNSSCGTSCGSVAHIDTRAFNQRLTVGLGFDF
jgi:outer membrane immunogenic protein